ncbi:MAG: glycosyltransferase [Nitrospirae bacterium]|nr:glycosyltransferase [Nitrospirota bacterium]
MLGVFAHQQVRHIAAAGVDVRVVSGVPWAPRPLWFKPKWRAYGEAPREGEVDGVRVNYPRYVEMPGSINFSWSGIALYAAISRTVAEIHSEFPFDVIHANTVVPDGFAGVWLARKYGVPCVCVSRGDLNIYPHYGPMSMRATRYVLRRCDRLVTVSGDLARVARGLEPQTPENIAVVYNGCDFERFKPADAVEIAELRRELDLPEDRIILFLLGAIEENKGIFELLEVYKRMLAKWGDGVHLVMIGGGKHEAAFRSRISEMGLDGLITLAGSVSHSMVSRWVRACDIMIFPTHYEGVPNAVLETMACGKPVIATAVGGIPEIIRDGETGCLVNVKDVDAMVKSADMLIESAGLRKKMGDAASVSVRAHASWKKNADSMINIYKEAIRMN